MAPGYASIERDGRTVEILEEHAEVWLEVPRSSLGTKTVQQVVNARACVSLGQLLEALREAGYTVTAPDWRALQAQEAEVALGAANDEPLPKVHPYKVWDSKRFSMDQFPD